MHTGIWRKPLKEGDCLEYTGVNERIILKWISKECDGKV
jgi:hypothetical protein